MANRKLTNAITTEQAQQNRAKKVVDTTAESPKSARLTFHCTNAQAFKDLNAIANINKSLGKPREESVAGVIITQLIEGYVAEHSEELNAYKKAMARFKD